MMSNPIGVTSQADGSMSIFDIFDRTSFKRAFKLGGTVTGKEARVGLALGVDDYQKN